MHVLIMIVIGAVLLAVMHFGPRLASISFDGAQHFIWIWLIVSILNGLYGHIRAGIPILNEVGAFIPIFGIPAATAWFLLCRG